MTIDPCNAVLVGADPAQFIAELEHAIVHFHLKDAVGPDGDFRIVQLGAGRLDVHQVLTLISETDIPSITFEHPGGLEDTTPKQYLSQISQIVID